ncbi:MAG: chemotaxis protein CheB [Campylobacteraceae bacterium]|nr:chemotaxis protein CheB [Campylobacteraceae bacterium]
MRHSRLIAIGSSTGGPGHIQKILAAIPSDFKASIVIGQHINSIFLDSIVESLNSFCKIPVYAGKDNLVIESPSVVFAKGAGINEVRYENGVYRLKILDTVSDDYSPSIDRLFFSMSSLPDVSNIMAVVLTGIGDDGARGLLELKKAGAYTVAESEQTSVVYGMPRAAYEMGAAREVLDLEKIVEKILEFGR